MLFIESQVEPLQIAESGADMSHFIHGDRLVKGRSTRQQKHDGEQADSGRARELIRHDEGRIYSSGESRRCHSNSRPARHEELPGLRGEDLRMPGYATDYGNIQHDLQVLLFPVARQSGDSLLEVLRGT